jgi:hypothetical protein
VRRRDRDSTSLGIALRSLHTSMVACVRVCVCVCVCVIRAITAILNASRYPLERRGFIRVRVIVGSDY